jgi:hypothetical protein
LGQFLKNFKTFYPKKLSLSSQKYGFGIRDPEKKPIPDPDPGVKKALDPGSGSATLWKMVFFDFRFVLNGLPMTLVN